ncbi:MAG: SIR2 family protein [Magnetococcales bacterium]|nr:SIR2 family protein [Magnetococcales bacterium]
MISAFAMIHGESREKGKVEFLNTMGFKDDEVMRGGYHNEQYDEVDQCYRNRLLPRHHVLARLAREGLTPILITTNYDMLLEGAYRLSDMEHDKEHGFTVINSPHRFFEKGHGHRTALLAKIHGCAYRYRNACENPEELSEYLPSIVFTYREIQNWRQDAWSRDFLHTMLRTRTVAFCSYSAMDPVIHDTFRNVYEELARYRLKSAATISENEVPAFIFDGKENFHGLEILRAASQAVGYSFPDITTHDNFVPFAFKSAGPSWPLIDHLFQWLYHLTMREQQKEFLHRKAHTLGGILGHPPGEDQTGALQRNFQTLIDWENQCAECGDFSQTSLEEFTSWSEHFHRLFLREMKLASNITSELSSHDDRRWPLKHVALNDHPAWALWALVVEIALRRMAADWANKKVFCSMRLCLSRKSGLPTVECSRMGDHGPEILRIQITFGAQERLSPRHHPSGAPTRQLLWSLSIPGLSQSLRAPGNRNPDVETLWRWAWYPEDRLHSLPRFLAIP